MVVSCIETCAVYVGRNLKAVIEMVGEIGKKYVENENGNLSKLDT